MVASTAKVNWHGKEARSGASTLNLLAEPLNGRILDVLRDGPKIQAELRQEIGQPPRTTLRARLEKLTGAGVVVRKHRNRFPSVVECSLSEAGHDLAPVSASLERWLAHSPSSPLELGGDAARLAVKALTEGWSTMILRVVVARPLTLPELDGLLDSIHYPSLERRLAAMRLAGLAEARSANGREAVYGVTDWARRGVLPLTAASLWERRHAPTATRAAGGLDIETAFLLVARLVRIPIDVSGSCRLAVNLKDRNRDGLAGVVVGAREGRVASCTTRLADHANAWASGSLAAWFAAVTEQEVNGLELGGDSGLARALVAGLHGALGTAPHRPLAPATAF